MKQKLRSILIVIMFLACFAFVASGCDIIALKKNTIQNSKKQQTYEQENSDVEQQKDKDESLSSELPSVFEEQTESDSLNEDTSETDEADIPTSKSDESTGATEVPTSETDVSTGETSDLNQEDLASKEILYKKDDFLPAGYFNEHPIIVAISYDFSEEEVEAIESAIQVLDDYAMGLKFEIIRTTDRKIQRLSDNQRIIIIKETEERMGGTEDFKPWGAASYPTNHPTKEEDYRGLIRISEIAEIKYYENIVIHEILHVLNFAHEDDKNSVMYYRVYRGKGLSETDIENINSKFPPLAEDELLDEEIEMD